MIFDLFQKIPGVKNAYSHCIHGEEEFVWEKEKESGSTWKGGEQISIEEMRDIVNEVTKEVSLKIVLAILSSLC